MRTGTKALRLVAGGVAICLVLAGCVGLGRQEKLIQSSNIPSRPRAVDFQAAPAAELRIPVDAVAVAAPPDKTPDIPLVPVPPVPLAGDRKEPPPNPPIPKAQPKAPREIKPASFDEAPTLTPAASPPRSPREVLQDANQAFAQIDSYIARLTRRDRAKNKNANDETLLFTFRKNPWSVHFKWLAGDGEGREVIYVKDHYENKLHTLLAAGDAPLLPAGKHLALPLNSFLVKTANRHPITDAGMGAIIDRLNRILEANQRGDNHLGKITGQGVKPHADWGGPLEGLEIILPPGADDDVPNGGRSLVYFDPVSHLPVITSLRDEHDFELDYNRFDRLQLNVKLDDADFNPDVVWKRPGPPATKGAAPDRPPVKK
jgi:hypothetical protein